jgi:hypothetical protein
VALTLTCAKIMHKDNWFLSLAIKISIDCSNKPMILFHALWIELGMPKDW